MRMSTKEQRRLAAALMGEAKTKAKGRASRENGKKGGRPKKKAKQFPAPKLPIAVKRWLRPE